MLFRIKLKYVTAVFLVLLIFVSYTYRVLLLKEVVFKEVSKHIYVSKNTPTDIVTKLIKIIDSSYTRNKIFWDSNGIVPDVYYLHDNHSIKLFSKSTSYATFNTVLLYDYITINPEGLNVDILSHEMCHANLYNNIGGWKWFKQKFTIPIWFDEGLALQLDYRTDYSLSYLDSISKQDSILYSKKMFENSSYYHPDFVWYNYIYSKEKVNRWLESNDFNLFISNIQSGLNFEKATGYVFEK